MNKNVNIGIVGGTSDRTNIFKELINNPNIGKIELKDDFIYSNEFIDAVNALQRQLEDNSWEINEDGDIVEKSSKRLVLDIIHGDKNE